MRRFPVGLTLAAAVGVAALVGLGVWQVQRLHWKETLLARIEALKTAQARPIVEALTDPQPEFQRVRLTCDQGPAVRRDAWKYAVRDGELAWRLISVCPLRSGPFDAIVIDRGLAAAMRGRTDPIDATFKPPAGIIGVLREPAGKPMFGPARIGGGPAMPAYRLLDAPSLTELARANGFKRPAPFLLAVETEDPAPAGLTPSPLPQDIPNNHYVYALTWFSLAAVLACFYGAMLFQRLRRS